MEPRSPEVLFGISTKSNQTHEIDLGEIYIRTTGIWRPLPASRSVERHWAMSSSILHPLHTSTPISRYWPKILSHSEIVAVGQAHHRQCISLRTHHSDLMQQHSRRRLPLLHATRVRQIQTDRTRSIAGKTITYRCHLSTIVTS
jgi:hypothetical protein